MDEHLHGKESVRNFRILCRIVVHYGYRMILQLFLQIYQRSFRFSDDFPDIPVILPIFRRFFRYNSGSQFN